MTQQTKRPNLLPYLLVLLVLVGVYGFMNKPVEAEPSYAEVRELFESEQVSAFTVTDTTLRMKLREPIDGKTELKKDLFSVTLFYDDLGELIEQQKADGIIEDYDFTADHSINYVAMFAPYILAVLGIFAIWYFLSVRSAGGGGGDRMAKFGTFKVSIVQSTLYVEPLTDDCDLDGAWEACGTIFGVAQMCRCRACEKDLDAIFAAVCDYLGDELSVQKSFKVESKRSDKSFPLNSIQISQEIGGRLAEEFPNVAVDVHTPDYTVNIEVRETAAYVHGPSVPGAGGLPTGTGGRAAVLLSGGIDSPVAGYMIAKRGVELIAIHFASPPYTSQRAEQKVHSLLRQVAKYSGRIMLFVVPFTEIQELIKDNCPEEVFTLIMRRMMMRISQEIAIKEGCQALITGESVGQVASQTMPAIACTDAVTSMPVFRPLIGMDKDEVIAISRKIETFDISIQPYEDCCTVFTPKHPRTHPTIAGVEKAERGTEWDEPIKRAVEGTKVTVIKAFSKGE